MLSRILAFAYLTTGATKSLSWLATFFGLNCQALKARRRDQAQSYSWASRFCCQSVSANVFSRVHSVWRIQTTQPRKTPPESILRDLKPFGAACQRRRLGPCLPVKLVREVPNIFLVSCNIYMVSVIIVICRYLFRKVARHRPLRCPAWS